MIGVLGGGAWGTALATAMASDGTPVVHWMRNAELADEINRIRENKPYLAGVRLGDSVRATADISELEAADLWLVVPPAQHLREILQSAPLKHQPTLVLCSKGIEAGTHALMAEVAAEAAPGSEIAILSGPSFAAEVGAGKPTAVTLAASNMDLASDISHRLARRYFRPYASDDVVGCEIGGAVKNVLAIACGVTVGAELGENARAAIIARGFAEMTRFGIARGARLETLTGLSGLGDLVLTCGSLQSRNMRLGVALGKDQTVEEALAGLRTVAEGAATSPVLVEAARQLSVDMPIVNATQALLSGQANVDEVVADLLSRPLQSEH